MGRRMGPHDRELTKHAQRPKFDSQHLYLGVMVHVCPTLRSWKLYDQKSKVIPGYIVWGLFLLHLYLFQCPIFDW